MTGIIELPRASLDRAQLDSLKQELEQELAALTGPGAEGEGTTVLDIRTQARARAIVSALARIREGTYGICRRCRAAIPYPRLAAIPEATTCVSCARGAS